MANRLRQYEKQLMLVVETIEEVIPGTGELDPITAGESAQTYFKALDSILRLEQQRFISNLRP